MKRCLMTVLVMAVAFSLVGCGSKRDRAARIITQTLEERYEESFVIDSMGGGWGTSDNSRLKAWVYPEGSKDRMFKVEIKKDLTLVEDEYINILMAEKFTHGLTPILESIYGDQFKVTAVAQSYISDIGFKDMEIEDFIQSDMYVGFAIKLYVKGDSHLDKEVELQALKDFSAEYDEIFGELTSLYVCYLKEPIFDALEIKREEFDHDMQKYLSSTENSYNYVRTIFPIPVENLTTDLFRD